MKSYALSRMAVLTALTAAAFGTHAQTFDTVRLQGPVLGNGEGRVGLAAIAGYQYLGSDERRSSVLPTLDYRWKNGWFAGVGNGIGYNFSSEPQYQYGLRLTGDFGRKESRSSALQGLGDISARAELGGFFNMHLSQQFSLSSSLRYGAGNDRKGMLLDLGAHYGTQVAERIRLGVSLSATYANQNYMQSYFGVTAEQSANSALTNHYAESLVGAGVRDVRLGTSVTYFISREWVAFLAVNGTSLQGDAKNAAIVRERSPVTGLLGVSYGF